MNWKKKGEKLTKQFVFGTQVELADALMKIALYSDEVNHHADMEVRHHKLNISITTHDIGGLTEKDFNLAETIDRIIEKS